MQYTFLLILIGLLPLSAMAQSRILSSGPGPEDLEFMDWGGRPALITATVTRLGLGKKSPGRLEVHVLGSDSGFLPQPCAYPPGWKPVGLSVLPRSRAPGLAGRQLVYVINVAPSGGLKGGQVEVFEIRGTAVHYLGHLGFSPLLAEANALVADADGTVYVSLFNTLPCREPKLTLPAADSVEAHTARKNAIACYTPGPDARDALSSAAPEATAPVRVFSLRPRWRIVAAGVRGANGLALTPDGRHLLCNVYHNRQVIAFPRQGDDSLREPFSIPGLDDLPFGPDNLKALPDGRYTTAGQRSFSLSAVHFLSFGSLPTSAGDALTFRLTPDLRLDGKPLSWRASLKGDGHAPSTVLPADHLGHPFGYTSHILHRDIRQIPLPEAR